MSVSAARPNDLISRREAARLLGRHISSVTRYVQAGKLNQWQIAGGHYAVSKAEVLALISTTSVKQVEKIAPRTARTARRETRAAMAELRKAGYDV